MCPRCHQRIPTDTEAELKLVEEKCKELGVNVVRSEVWAKAAEGGVALGRRSCPSLCEQPNDFNGMHTIWKAPSKRN